MFCSFPTRRLTKFGTLIAIASIVFVVISLTCRPILAAGGTLTFTVDDQSDSQPLVTRMELYRGRPDGRPMTVRQTVPAGFGTVFDRQVVLSLPDGPYFFRLIRGPEYQIVSGNFVMERTSLDEKNVSLPRMIDMQSKGWTSGDCCVVPSPNSLPLRMASEDLHVATVLGHADAKPIPRRDRDEKIENDPTWIREDASHYDGLLFVGMSPEEWSEIESDARQAPTSLTVPSLAMTSGQRIAAASRLNTPDEPVHIAIENPFAWELPIWLASSKIEGVFVLGDWLRLNRKVLKPKDGRGPQGLGFDDGVQLGRWGEQIYRNILDAGFRMPPLAGGGSDSAGTPVGYNRLYVTAPSDVRLGDQVAVANPVQSIDQWWNHALSGNSVATNGPMLRPRLAGQIPGYVFKAKSGELLELQGELELSVRDEVDYLEVIHNNRVHYSARLDEFAAAGGRLPVISTQESGWVIMRVITLHEDHYRAAVSAPWYIEFDGKPRVSKDSVEFFQKWLAEHETRLRKLPPEEIQAHVPFVRAARAFWQQKQDAAGK